MEMCPTHGCRFFNDESVVVNDQPRTQSITVRDKEGFGNGSVPRLVNADWSYRYIRAFVKKGAESVFLEDLLGQEACLFAHHYSARGSLHR
jgi:hypothetical protein